MPPPRLCLNPAPFRAHISDVGRKRLNGMTQQMAQFNARIGRINNPGQAYWTDPETGINVPRRLNKATIIKNNFPQKQSLMSIVMSVLLGVICLMAARYVRFNFAEIPTAGTGATTLTVMDCGIALFLALLVGGMLQLKTFRHVLGQVSGIAVMLVAMHNLVWIYPGEFAQVYSQAYVDQVISLTEPLSIYFNGSTVIDSSVIATL